MRLKAYVDEDIPVSFAQALLNRGVDVVTTGGAGNKGFSDAEQLAFAAVTGASLVTHNRKDFILLHHDYLRSGRPHAGPAYRSHFLSCL